QLPRGQCVGVEPDADGIAQAAAGEDLGYAVEHREAVVDVAPGEIGELLDAHPVRGEPVPDDGLRIGFLLAYQWRIDLVGQAFLRARDRAAHVVGGGIDVAPHGECDVDVRATVQAGRDDLVQSGNARQGILDHFGHTVFHHLRVGTAVGDGHRYHRAVHVRQFAQRQRLEAQ